MKSKTIKRLIMFTAIVVIMPAFFSCGPGENTFSFAFLTDIHIKPEKNAAEGFKMAAEKVNGLKPDFVLTGGDQVFDAFDQGYERADLVYRLYLETVKTLVMPVYNTLGNHDIFGLGENAGIDPGHSEAGKKMFMNRQAKSRYYSFDHKGWRFFVLDSVQPIAGGGYRGGIDLEQMGWISEKLRTLEKGTPIVLSTHIPFISVTFQLREQRGEYRDNGLLIDNAFEVLNLFQGHNLRLVLQGHLHAYEDITYQGIRFVTGGAVSANWWDGPLNHMEESFLMVRIKGNRIDCELIDYGWEAVIEKE